MAKKNKPEIEIIEEDNKKDKDNGSARKTVLTLFLFVLPMLVIAYTNEFITKALLFCYLAVLLSNFIRDKSSTD